MRRQSLDALRRCNTDRCKDAPRDLGVGCQESSRRSTGRQTNGGIVSRSVHRVPLHAVVRRESLIERCRRISCCSAKVKETICNLQRAASQGAASRRRAGRTFTIPPALRRSPLKKIARFRPPWPISADVATDRSSSRSPANSPRMCQRRVSHQAGSIRKTAHCSPKPRPGPPPIAPRRHHG